MGEGERGSDLMVGWIETRNPGRKLREKELMRKLEGGGGCVVRPGGYKEMSSIMADQ